MKNVVVASAVRTPFGSIDGTLGDIEARDLIGVAPKGVIEKAGIAGEWIDEAVCGPSTRQSTNTPGAARVATFGAKISEEIPAYFNDCSERLAHEADQ
jgi:acetyl-CoA C-acetyltransferase